MVPVKIHLTTVIRLDNEEEKYELTVFGRHYRKKNAVFLKYDEVQEDGTTHTVVKISKDEALILRSGHIKMRLRFRMSEELEGSHESSYGSLFLTTKTKHLKHQQSEDTCEGQFSLIYDLYMQGTQAGQYEMKIDYKEDASK